MMAWLLLLSALALALPARAHEIGSDAFSSLPQANVVILGEVHDNPLHHHNQALAVSAIRPSALVLEMLTAEQAARIPDDQTDAQVVARATGWEGSGWPDFAFYHPILMAAPNTRIYGAGVVREEARRVLSEDLADVFGDDAALFGLTQALAPADQRRREDEQAAAHCDALPGSLLPGMVAAQRLRDAVMAQTALRALDETGGPVVIIAGSGHARTDIGIPAMLRFAAAEVSVLSIGQLEAPPGPQPRFDLWIVTPPPARADPCAAFD